MSEFSHIEITIETVATDGTRTRTTRWACPSVEMGSTRDQRVQLRFAGEPVVVAGEPATRCPVDGLRYVEGSEPMKPLSDADTAREVMGEISRRYTVTRTLRPGDFCAATCATFDWAGLASEMDAAVAELRRAHAVMQTCDDAPPDTCATESPRDVATDPRVGDRVTVGGWLRTVEAVEPGRILVYSGPRFYWRPEEWAFLCQMPGAVIERAEDPPPRDVARSPKVGDRITINEAGERTMYEVQGFPEEGIACWASADGRPIGPCVVSPARWKAACGEGSGAVIERAPE